MEAFCTEAERTRDGLHCLGLGDIGQLWGGALFNTEHIWRKLASKGEEIGVHGQGWGTAAVNGLSTRGWRRNRERQTTFRVGLN